jgi:hypothetical protein
MDDRLYPSAPPERVAELFLEELEAMKRETGVNESVLV